MTKSKSIVRKATTNDLADILDIQKYHHIDGKEKEKLSKEGFLVYLINRNELTDIIKNNNQFLYVHEGEKGIDGYLVAYIKDEWLNIKPQLKYVTPYREEYQCILDEDYVYLRHIAKRDKAQPGVATLLVNHLFKESAKKGFNRVIAEISINPCNEASIKFHEKIGFNIIGEYYDIEKNVKWGVFYKELHILLDASKN
jgi:predicted GNAT superfamily acetyltransferase